MPYFGPEESEITAGDYSQFFQYGMYGLMGSVTGLAREYGGADVGAILKPTQGGLRESQEAQLGDMTSAGRELFQSDIFSSEFYDSPVGWATAQAMGMAPYMAASILPVIATGGYGGLALGAISSGILTDADMTSSVQDLVDTATHEDLLKSKQYADDIEGGFSEQEARQNLLDTMLGPGAHATAIGLGALSAGLGVERITGGAAGRVLGRGAAGKLIPKPSGGVISTAAKETVLGGGAEFGEEAGTETLIERAEITGGLREDYDPGRIARAGATGAIIGGPIGTVGGAIEGFGRGGKKTTAEPAKPSTEIDPAVEAAARGQPVVPVSGGTGGAPVSPPAGTKPSAIPITTAASGVAGGTVPAVTGPAPTGAPARAGAPTPASPGSLTGGAIPTLSEKVTKLADPISPSPEVTAALAAKTPPAPQAQAQAPPATPPARVPPAQPTPSPAAVPPARVPPQQPVPPGEQVQAGMPPLKTNVPPAGNIPPTNVPPAGPVPAPQTRTPEAVQAGLPPLRPNVPPAAPVPAANVPPMQPVPQGAPVPAARVPPAQPIPAPGQSVVPQGAPLAQRPLPIQPVPPVGRVAPVAPPQAIVEPAPVAPAPVEAVVTPEVRGPKVLEAIQTVAEKKATRRALAQERLERIKRTQEKRAPLGPEETAALHEAQVETGKIGPKEKAKKASDKAGAKKLFDKHAPDPETRETDEEVKTRINAIADEANKTGTRMPDRIKVNTTEQIWLADVKKLKAAFDKGKATADHIATFLYRERALKTGDEAPLREERKATGKEQSQAKQELKEEVAVDAGIPKEDIPVSQQMEEATVVEAEAEEITEVAPREKRPASKAERIKQVSEERAAKKKEEAETKEVAKEKAEYEARVTSEVAKPSKPVLVASKARPKLPLKMRFREALRRLDRNPTAAEIAAGNARTAQFSWHGLDTVVTGLVDKLYSGHIKGTKGADGRPVSILIGPNIDSTNVLVVDQLNPTTGEFIKHRVLIGFDNVTDAINAFNSIIDKGITFARIGDVTPMTVEELKTWVKDKEVTSEPVGAPELEEAEVAIAAKGAPNYGVTSYVTEEVANKYASGLASWKGKLDKLGVTPASFDSWRDTLIPLMEAGLFGKGVSNRILPRIFDGITNAIADVPVYIVSDAEMQSVTGQYVPAAYNQLQNIIVISESHGPTGLHHKIFPRIMVHEGIHAAFIKATFENNNIRAFVTDVAREFREALDAAGHSTDFYAFQDVHEFIAEAFSNSTMQRALAQTKASPALRKALVDARAKPFGKPIRTLWDAIRRVVGSVIGLKGTETENTLLDAMMIAAADLQSTPTGINPGAMSAVEVYEMRDQENWESSDPDSPWEIDPQEVNFPSLALAGPKNFAKVGDYLSENLRPAERTFQTRMFGLKFESMDGLARRAKSFGDTFAKHVRDLYNADQGLHVRALELFRESEKFVIEVIDAKKKFKGERWDRFAAYLNKETKAGVYGDRALDDQPHLGKDGGENVLTSVNARAKHAELAAEWAQLDPELQALRNKMLEHFKGQYEGAAQEILENIIVRLTGQENNALAKKIFDKEDLTLEELTQLGDSKELINHIRHTRELGKIKGPYYPLMRIGQFVASGTYKFDPPTDGVVVKDTQNTFEFSGDKARERAIAYANKQDNYVRVMKTWVDPTTGEVFFGDVNEEGMPIQVQAGPTIPEAEARYRVFVQDQYTEFFDTLKDAQEMDFELRKDKNYTPSHLGPRQFNPFEQSKRGIMSNEINQLLDTMYKRPEFNQMTPEAKHDLEKALRELSLRMHGSTRIQARGLPRRNVLGASRDVVNVSLQHAEAMAGYRAKLQMQRHIDSARDAMVESVNDPNEGGGQKSWAARQAISNEMVDRTAKITTQAPPTKWDQAVNRVTATSFVHYLMSPAYAINNFLQVAMLAYPQLAAKYGSGTAIRLLMKAYKDIGVMKVLKAGAKETARAAKGGVRVRHNFLTEVLAGIHDPGEKIMLEHLRKTGSITPESGLEIDRMINGGNVDKAIDYFQGMARAMPAAIETINRVTVGLAAYRAEMKKSGDQAKAILSAQEMVNLTQGNYSAANMPAFFNHPLGRLALQFKKYGFTVYGQLGHNIGLILRDANPGDRAEGAKALMMLAATHVIMAGALGLPTEPLRWLVTGANAAGLTEANWDDVENWVREMGAGALGPIGGELATRGFPRMFGLDLSERLGSQNLLTHGIPRSNDEYGLYAFMGELLSGAPVAMGMDIRNGFNDILNGDFIEGASKAVPMKVFRDSIKSYTMATEGKKTPAGYTVLPPSGIVDTILGGLGYQTAEKAEVQERRGYIASAASRLSKQRGELEREWHQATPNERVKIWGKIEQYNRTVPRAARLTRAMVQDYSKRKKGEEVDAGFPVNRINRDLIRSTQGTYVTR